MEYEEFLYELIKMLIEYGAWTGNVKIVYRDKTYEPCEGSKKQYHNTFGISDFWIRRDIYKKMKAEEEKNKYTDLKNVLLADVSDEDVNFKTNWPDKCEMCIQLNSELNSLFVDGFLVVDLWDMPLSVKEEEYEMDSDLQDDFRSYYDEIDIKMHPEEYGFPSELDFDSADEYQKLYDEEMEKAEKEYIESICGKKEFGNDLEAEICDLCIKHGLSYSFTGDSLFIGHDYF